MIEGLAGILELLMYWRAVLCLAASAVLAIVLVQLFPWISVLQGFALAFFGFIPGVVWEEQAAGRKVTRVLPPRPTSIGVVITSALLAGSAWGAVSATSLHSFLAGSIIFVIVAASAIGLANGGSSLVPYGAARLRLVVAAVAYPVAALLIHYVL